MWGVWWAGFELLVGPLWAWEGTTEAVLNSGNFCGVSGDFRAGCGCVGGGFRHKVAAEV